MSDLRIAVARGRVVVKRRDQVLVDAETPADGVWLWPRDGSACQEVTVGEAGALTVAGEALPARPRGIVLKIADGQAYLLRAPCPSCWSPMGAVGLDDLQTWAAGLTDAQVREALAWLVFQHRETLPADITDAIQSDPPTP